jgi:hypothetical protein
VRERGWQRKFDDPIPVPKGESLLTLKDAAKYVVALPAKTSAREPWQFAMQMLIDAADRGGIVMLARIVMLRALNQGKPERSSTSRHCTVSPSSDAIIGREGHWQSRVLRNDLDWWQKSHRIRSLSGQLP